MLMTLKTVPTHQCHLRMVHGISHRGLAVVSAAVILLVAAQQHAMLPLDSVSAKWELVADSVASVSLGSTT